MPMQPAENHESYVDADPRLKKATEASPELSIAMLTSVLESKAQRMDSHTTPGDPRQAEQFALEKGIILQRLELVHSMA